MADLDATARKPEVVSVIGPYEILPKVEGADEVWLGEEGAIWAEVPEEPILWREVVALRVAQPDVEGVVGLVVEADMGPTPLAPNAKVRGGPICIGLPGDVLAARAAQISDRLLRYYLDHGIAKAEWPKVDLEPQKGPGLSQGRWRELAIQVLGEYKAICPSQVDPVLGEYVEVGWNHRRPWIWAALAWASFAGLMYMAGDVATRENGRLYAGMIFIAIMLGVWWAVWGCMLWPVRRRRVRVGEQGLQVVPDTEPIQWRQLSRLELDTSGLTPKLSIWAPRPLDGRGAAKALTKRTRYAYVFRLPNMQEPPGSSGFSSLVCRHYEAGRSRDS